MNLKKVLLVSPLALLFVGAGLLLQPSPSLGVSLDDDQARQVVGGQTNCGNLYSSGSVACNGGTVQCRSFGVLVYRACSGATYTSLIKGAAGNQKPDPNATVSQTCSVCGITGSTMCGTATVINGTIPCSP